MMVTEEGEEFVERTWEMPIGMGAIRRDDDIIVADALDEIGDSYSSGSMEMKYCSKEVIARFFDSGTGGEGP
jgi:hypothetical protein